MTTHSLALLANPVMSWPDVSRIRQSGEARSVWRGKDGLVDPAM